MATTLSHVDSARAVGGGADGHHDEYSQLQRRQAKEGAFFSMFSVLYSRLSCLQIEKLRTTLSNKKNLLQFKRPIRLPLDPMVRVTGVLAENASMFKSALTPAKLGFKTTTDDVYWVSIIHV